MLDERQSKIITVRRSRSKTVAKNYNETAEKLNTTGNYQTRSNCPIWLKVYKWKTSDAVQRGLQQ